MGVGCVPNPCKNPYTKLVGATSLPPSLRFSSQRSKTLAHPTAATQPGAQKKTTRALAGCRSPPPPDRGRRSDHTEQSWEKSPYPCFLHFHCTLFLYLPSCTLHFVRPPCKHCTLTPCAIFLVSDNAPCKILLLHVTYKIGCPKTEIQDPLIEC